jgi:uncharacterized protein
MNDEAAMDEITVTPRNTALARILGEMGETAIAVSGGVDSLTLAVLAHRLLGRRSEVFHAVSPAVPPEATDRVRDLAVAEGWRLSVIDAGEFANGDYRATPVNRCFYCKSSLYAAIRRHTARQILSGTNLDDLGDYRPGLDAARAHDVRHPYVEAGLPKREVRALARELGLGGIAELPAAPCLSSRIETGLRIEAETLGVVHRVETMVAERLAPEAVRCRVRARGVVIELDEASLARLRGGDEASLLRSIADLVARNGIDGAVSLAPYRMGSAFLRGQR